MNPLTVSALTTHIVTLFEREELLRDVAVVGEVSNWKRATSGHLYFSLKDAGATISVVMWKGNALAHSWLPSDGDQVIATGYVGVYPERGVYQLYANRIQAAGRGILYAQFEALKARLEAEGLFDMGRKRLIVSLPRRVAVVTSATGAALRDILRVFSARWPLVDVILFPASVQGQEAPGQIAYALAMVNAYVKEVEPIDTVILARGGGSIEDLWAFNDERVAYAIAACDVPVITGIGHEVDFTIADFVADLRAPTPSAAAVAAVPDRTEAINGLIGMVDRMAGWVSVEIEQRRRDLDNVRQRIERLHPQRMLDVQRQRLDDRVRQLQSTIARQIQRRMDRTAAAKMRLNALDPQAVLRRGYSIVQKLDGTLVRSPEDTASGEVLRVQSAAGTYEVVRSSSG